MGVDEEALKPLNDHELWEKVSGIEGDNSTAERMAKIGAGVGLLAESMAKLAPTREWRSIAQGVAFAGDGIMLGGLVARLAGEFAMRRVLGTIGNRSSRRMTDWFSVHEGLGDLPLR